MADIHIYFNISKYCRQHINVTSQTRDKVKLDYCMNSSAFTHTLYMHTEVEVQEFENCFLIIYGPLVILYSMARFSPPFWENKMTISVTMHSIILLLDQHFAVEKSCSWFYNLCEMLHTQRVQTSFDVSSFQQTSLLT